jgi:hypothetical protein
VFVSTIAIGQTGDSVEVRVLDDGQHCMVFEQQLACDAIGAYLKDARHLPFSQPILVNVDGVGDASHAGGLKTGQSLNAAGYSDVYVVGFLTEPRSSSDTSP